MKSRVAIGAVLLMAASAIPASAAEMLRPARQRYADPGVEEVPDFQRHILPLMGRLGCNTRSCHGSFQGRGGLRLSLFGYDFKMDHEALMAADEGRVEVEAPEASLILQKPTLGVPHKGGKRMEVEGWQYQMLYRWIDAGARPADGSSHFDRLEVIPGEVVFKAEGETVPLKVIAHWADGSSEDVTCITRFRTNDESIAEVDDDGTITSRGKGDTHVVAFYDNGVAATQVILPVSDKVGPDYPDLPAPTKVDRLVVEKLRKLGIVPSAVCSDSEFLRRVSLDVTGSLPTPDEVRAFLADGSPGKRERKVDELLSRPTYAARWTNKLCDLTGNSVRNLQGQVAAEQFARHWYDWIYRRVSDNTPYDRLVAGIVLGTSRRPGQTYDQYIEEQATYYRDEAPADYTERDSMPYFWARRNLRKPEEKALAFSYTFLGVRLECAQCHKHPFDQWTQDDFNQFTAFFNPVAYGLPQDARARSREILKDLGLAEKPGGEVRNTSARLAREGKVIPWQEVFVNRAANRPRPKAAKAAAAKSARVVTPKVLGGDEVSLADYDDSREPLMDWMRAKDNPYFARAFVNRVWAEYFNAGIIDPADDLNLANPPSNAALLDYLVDGFIGHEFDMKWLHREIVTSLAYQRSWEMNETNRLDERNFSRAVVRRLPAEVLLDAVTQATAGPADLARATTSVEDRAIGPKSGSGAARRGGDYASKVFGRSTRDTNCDCSRSDEPNLLQAIFLQNDQDLLGAIDRRGGWLADRAASAGRSKPEGGSGVDDAIARQVEGLERRLKAMGDARNPARARKIEERLAALREQAGAPASEEAAARADVEEVVREAYLRTLSRLPDGRELEVAREHFGRSDDAQKGLRDLLWALLNTKEFITNH